MSDLVSQYCEEKGIEKYQMKCCQECGECEEYTDWLEEKADGWRDARKELPADGEQVIWAVLWKGNCDQGLESPDEYEYIYGRYYEEMEVVRLPWSDKEYKVKLMHYWRRIETPAFV